MADLRKVGSNLLAASLGLRQCGDELNPSFIATCPEEGIHLPRNGTFIWTHGLMGHMILKTPLSGEGTGTRFKGNLEVELGSQDREDLQAVQDWDILGPRNRSNVLMDTDG